MYAYPHENNFKIPGKRWPQAGAPGLKIKSWCSSELYKILYVCIGSDTHLSEILLYQYNYTR